jgi:hypothetical protein
MEAYADPLKYYPPDPANETDPKEKEMMKIRESHFKGIVSRDFEVCFLIPLESSHIATPDGTGKFFLKSIFQLFGPWR